MNRYGDPLGLKSNTWVSLLTPISTLNNFELRPNSVVTHLEQAQGRITRVHYRDAGGAARTVDGTAVVVACSAIESVRLLMLSGLVDQDFDRRINRQGAARQVLPHPLLRRRRDSRPPASVPTR